MDDDNGTNGVNEVITELKTLRESLDTKIKEVVTRDRQRRVQVLILTISVILDLALSVGFFVAINIINNNQDRTDAIVARLEELDTIGQASCLARNESAELQHQLWEGVIAQAIPPANQTEKEIKIATTARDRFLLLLDQTFVIKKCKL